MKNAYKTSLILFLLPLLLLSACSGPSASEKDNIQLQKKAKSWNDADYKQSKVPLHSYVKLYGVIQKSDGKNEKVGKNNRFILMRSNTRYQVINGTNKEFKVGDKVTVYGEYYGFIKAMSIEQ
ncbi:MAG: hypothetical protein LBV19_02815 [Streptococcaceae bacterium]|nr:hypothetical protein [Streptococcaceae bacterium]